MCSTCPESKETPKQNQFTRSINENVYIIIPVLKRFLTSVATKFHISKFYYSQCEIFYRITSDLVKTHRIINM